VKRFVLTRLARRDLEEIWEYVANDSVKAATRVLNHLEATIRALARNPGMGHVRADLADRRHRFFPAGSYLIVYRSQTKPLQIVRILHASRDVQALLDIEPDSFQTDDLK
jgi:plasmid stabilization system protein ParE